MRPRSKGGAAACLLSLCGTAAAQTHTVGLFFDDLGQACTAEIRNYQEMRAHIYAMVPAGTEVNGALLSVVLPAGVYISGETAAKDGVLEGSLTGADGLSVTLQKCPVAAGPVLLVSFDLRQADPQFPGGARVPDMLLEIRGAVTPADSLRFEKPHVKVCDPDDPINGDPELVEAGPIRSTLNCSADCPCTTPIGHSTWAQVKSAFRGR